MSDNPRNQATCSSCQKPIDWARTEAGRLMPIDTDSAGQPGGNIGVVKHPNGDLTCRVLTADRPLEPGEVPGMAHWATCPRARAHRTKR